MQGSGGGNIHTNAIAFAIDQENECKEGGGGGRTFEFVPAVARQFGVVRVRFIRVRCKRQERESWRYAHSTSGNALVVYEMSRQVLPTAPSPTITHFTFCIIDIVQGEADTRGLPRCRTTPVSCAEREPGSVVPPVPPRAAGQAATVAPWRAP